MSLFYVIFAWVCTFCFLSLQLTRPHKSKQGNIQLHVSVIDNYRSGVLISPASKGRIVMAVNKKQLIINCYIWSAVITYLLSTLVCFCFINDWLIIWLAVCIYLQQGIWVNLTVHFQGYLNKFWHHISCFWSNSLQKATFLLLFQLESTFFQKMFAQTMKIPCFKKSIVTWFSDEN